MPTEEGKVGIPESITINGVVYMVKDTPELQQFIQSVARVEKSKLYSQYENLKAQIQNLGSAKVETSFDVDAMVEKLKGTFMTKEDFTTMLPNAVKEVVQPILNVTEENRKNELQTYREKLISENAATCIPDLVKGETKEELDASLAESIRLRASYPTPSTIGVQDKPVKDPLIQSQTKSIAEDYRTTPTPQTPQPTPAPQRPIIPTAPQRPSPEVSTQDNVKGMSMNEFENRREALLAQLQATYGM